MKLASAQKMQELKTEMNENMPRIFGNDNNTYLGFAALL